MNPLMVILRKAKILKPLIDDEQEAIESYDEKIRKVRTRTKKLLRRIKADEIRHKRELKKEQEELGKAITGKERSGHKYIRRWVENGEYRYEYPDEGEGDKNAAIHTTKQDQRSSEREARTTDSLADDARANSSQAPQQTALDATTPYDYGDKGRIELARNEITVRPTGEHLSQALRGNLRQHQADFINLALEKFEAGERAMLCEDGTGAGKTREELGLAQATLDNNPNAKIIIVTDSDRIIESSMQKDADAMGIKFTHLQRGATAAQISGPGIYILPYSRLVKVKDAFARGFDLAIYDEVHNIKNLESAKTGLSLDLMKNSSKIGMFSATPIDKAKHIHYLCSAYGLNDNAVMGFLGYTRVTKTFGKKIVAEWDTNLPAAEIADRLGAMFDGLTRAGLCVKREVSQKNLDLRIEGVKMSDADQKRWDTAEAAYANDFESAGGLKKAQGLMGLRRLAEDIKYEHAYAMVKDRLAKGRQVVLFACRVNDSEMDKLGLQDPSQGTLLRMQKQLKAEGIECGDIFDSNPQTQQMAKDFQDGKLKVIITTPESGGTGLSFDDTTGKNPRTAIVMTPPFSAMSFIQVIGRVNRLTTKSRAEAVMLTSDTLVDNWNTAIIANKTATLGAAVAGDYSKIKVQDLERMKYMSEDEAKAYLASDKAKAVIAPTGPKQVFDINKYKGAEQYTRITGIERAKRIQSILTNAPAVTTFDNMTITKIGDKFHVQTKVYNQAIVDAIKTIPNGERFWSKTSNTWIVDALHYDTLAKIGKSHASLTDQQRDAIKLAKTSAPPSVSGGGLTAQKVGDVYKVTFNVSRQKFRDVLEAVKAIPNRRWNGAEKAWYVPAEHHEHLKKIVDGLGTAPSGGGGGSAGGGGHTQAVDPVARAAAHEALQKLAAMDDDRATQKNNAGFSRFDGDFGHRLAGMLSLTDNQYNAARILVQKYARQLPKDLVDKALGRTAGQTGQPPTQTKSMEHPMMVILDKARGVFPNPAYPEGAIRAHGKRKVKKVGGLWVPVKGGKTAEEAAEEAKASKGKPARAKIDGDPHILQHLEEIHSGGAPYMDDINRTAHKRCYDHMHRHGLMEWKHAGSDEYRAELTEHGRNMMHAGRAAMRKRERKLEDDRRMQSKSKKAGEKRNGSNG